MSTIFYKIKDPNIISNTEILIRHLNLMTLSEGFSFFVRRYYIGNSGSNTNNDCDIIFPQGDREACGVGGVGAEKQVKIRCRIMGKTGEYSEQKN